MLDFETGSDASTSYAVEFQDGRRQVAGRGPLSFTLAVPDENRLDRLMHAGAWAAAKAFVNGEIDLSGDIVAAIRTLRRGMHPGIFQQLWAALSRLGSDRMETWFQSRERAAGDIRFHYDRSNEFYSKFLDARFVYSAALFSEPGWSLERAQLAKLDSICRRLHG